ncbi:MAG: WXG100 family type VII secretion target [Pseudonocardiaceae bacterium]
MTTPGDQIKVTFGAIDSAASDTDTVASQIDQQLDDLKAYIAPLVASWTGEASTDYQALQTKWDTSAAELNDVLRQIATALRTSNENYNSAEQTNKAVWAR